MKTNAAAAMWGLLIGDALGVPYEFTAPDELPDLSFLDMRPAGDFDRTHASVLPGTWSDDGSQALVLLHHLQEHDGFNANAFAHDLLRWRKGWLWVDNVVFDVGLQTERVLRRLAQGIAVEQATEANEHSNGNGSLMRVLPLALWHEGSDEALVRLAHAQSCVTHAHAQSLVSCALYVLIARKLINERVTAEVPGSDNTIFQAVAKLRAIYQKWSAPEREALLETLDWLCAWTKTHRLGGKGYVVDSLWSCLSTLKARNFREAIQQAIAFGNDTDTTAALAGGLAGLRFGMAGLPNEWMQDLRGKALAEPLISCLSGAAPES